MTKKNLSADKSGKVISSTSANIVSGSSSEYDKSRKNSKRDLTDEEKRELFEKYKPSGDFEKDFNELCSLAGFPSLHATPRVKRPISPSSSPPETSMSKASKEDKKHSNNHQEASKKDDPTELPPTTYHEAPNKYDYFKPKLEVESEDEGNRSFVKEIIVRGWKVDERVIDVLTVTMPELDRLSVVDLWNAGLNDELLTLLHKCLSSSTSVKTLRLDGNCHVESQRFDLFLTSKTPYIQNLSLKSCQLKDDAAIHLADALVDNKTLLTLNLCFNKISDEGAKHIAKALKLNRTLLSLNLSGNTISNAGASMLAEALSTFALTHEQVVARRMLKSTHIPTEDSTTISPNHSSYQERPPTASRSFSEKRNKDKSSKKKDANNNNKLKDSAVKRGPSSIDTTKGQKNQKKGAVKVDRNKTPQPEGEDAYEFKNPLLEKANEVNGELWIAGNRALINLNLSRNAIGEKGLNMLYTAMKYQVDLAHENNRVVATGLMRLSIQQNDFSCEHPTYMKLYELMKTRDPFYVPPTPSLIEEEAHTAET